MSRINSNKKGGNGERRAKKFFQDWTGWDFERVPRSGGLRWKKADNITGDIICTKPNIIFPFSIEVKWNAKIDFSQLLRPNLKKVKIRNFWDQAVSDSKRSKKIPLLLMRYNGLPPNFFFVVIPSKIMRTYYEKFYQLPLPYLRGGGLFITTTEALLEIKYKRLHKLGLKWLDVL